MKRKAIRNPVSIAYAMAVTYAIGKWGFYMADLERGYQAVGGEYCLIPIVFCIAWKAVNYLFDTLEDLDHERDSKERRSREASRMWDNK